MPRSDSELQIHLMANRRDRTAPGFAEYLHLFCRGIVAVAGRRNVGPGCRGRREDFQQTLASLALVFQIRVLAVPAPGATSSQQLLVCIRRIRLRLRQLRRLHLWLRTRVRTGLGALGRFRSPQNLRGHPVTQGRSARRGREAMVSAAAAKGTGTIGELSHRRSRPLRRSVIGRTWSRASSWSLSCRSQRRCRPGRQAAQADRPPVEAPGLAARRARRARGLPPRPPLCGLSPSKTRSSACRDEASESASKPGRSTAAWPAPPESPSCPEQMEDRPIMIQVAVVMLEALGFIISYRVVIVDAGTMLLNITRHMGLPIRS